MELLQIDFVLWVVCLLAESILAVAIVGRRLYHRYPIFLAYLITEVLSSLILIQIDFRSSMYNDGYRIYESLIIVLRLAVTAEVIERFLEHFIGIGAFRFGMVALLGVVAIAVSYVAWAKTPAPRSWMWDSVVMFKRSETTALALLLPLLWLFSTRLMNVRPTLRANVSAHWKILTAYFALSSLASASVLITGGGKYMHPINIAMLGGDILCMLAWLIYLQPQGEEYRPVKTDPEDRRARDRLINDLLDHLKNEAL